MPRLCNVDECTKRSRPGFGRCKKHGGARQCAQPECNTAARDGFDRCKKHGGARRCTQPDCDTTALDGYDRCFKHGGKRRCKQEDCAKWAVNGYDYCVRHGGGPRCTQADCVKGAVSGFRYCSMHGGGHRCKNADCSTAAASGFDYCVRHGGSHRCQSEACSIHDVRPTARYRSGSLRVCWSCFAALEPGKAKLKVRSEHYIVDELIRRLPELLGKAQSAVWDCRVPGGCSLKRPDLLYVFDDRYVQIEIDEKGHWNYNCYDEDARLEIIAADVGLPGIVVRLNPDSPQCFGTKRLSNGEQVVQIKDRAAFDALMDATCQAVDTYLANPPPPIVVRVNLPASSSSSSISSSKPAA